MTSPYQSSSLSAARSQPRIGVVLQSKPIAAVIGAERRAASASPRRGTQSPARGSNSSFDSSKQLLRAAPRIVKTRAGTVLSRGFILKTDYYPTGRAKELDITLDGAPNFRAPRYGSLNVYGTAQPRIVGIKAIRRSSEYFPVATKSEPHDCALPSQGATSKRQLQRP